MKLNWLNQTTIYNHITITVWISRHKGRSSPENKSAQFLKNRVHKTNNISINIMTKYKNAELSPETIIINGNVVERMKSLVSVVLAVNILTC